MSRRPHPQREQSLHLLRTTKKTNNEIAAELNVSAESVRRWRGDVATEKRKAKAKTTKTLVPKKPKASVPAYLSKQLEIIAQLIRTKLPELARFALTSTADGKAQVEYTVRQTQTISGTVAL